MKKNVVTFLAAMVLALGGSIAAVPTAQAEDGGAFCWDPIAITGSAGHPGAKARCLGASDRKFQVEIKCAYHDGPHTLYYWHYSPSHWADASYAYVWCGSPADYYVEAYAYFVS
ncbi:hypothetical protein ABZ721_39565 [Streptomyces sp. NPDC006733]|uniref:hypothetical protein n=1 Tax=Streptomyces sp. NPDC006733 TaxID=3155460 RepID=UPI0033DB18BE